MEMASIWQLQIELGINLVFITIMTGFLFYIIINSRWTKLLTYYCFLHLLVILIFAGDFASMLATDIAVRWKVISLTYILKFICDTLFLLYNRSSIKTRSIRNIIVVLLSIYVVTGITIIITNPLHHLFVQNMTANENTFGVLFYIMMVSGYIIQTTGVVSIVKFWVGKLDNIAYRVFSSICALICILVLHLFLARIIRTSVNFLPVIILLGFCVSFIGGYKYGMLDIISYGSKHGIEMFTDALLIVDRKMRILYRNKVCKMLESKMLQEILDRFMFELQHKPAKWTGSKTEIEVSTPTGMQYFTISIYPIKRRIFPSNKSIFIIHDSTEILSTIRSLSEKNQYLEEMNESIKMLSEDTKKLAVLKQRNLLAKEIHDVIGHSLILSLNIMESNKLLIDRDRATAVCRIEQTVCEINDSLKEIAAAKAFETGNSQKGHNATRCPEPVWYGVEEKSYSGGQAEASHISFTERLRSLSFRLSEVGIILEITAMDSMGNCDIKVINTLYRICQESVTNAIKHGKASRITISLKTKQDIIELFIVDNGKGCTSFSKGTGLTSMEERIHDLQGTIIFNSFEDKEGFLVHASIPLHS